MALPTLADINAAVGNIFLALAADKSAASTRSGVQSLNEILPRLVDAYEPEVDFVVTDSTDASLTAFYASTGELAIALAAANQQSPRVGTVFQVGGAGDVTDNALGTAKGSAVADGDLFEVTNIGTPAAVYLGVGGTVDLVNEEESDFTGINDDD